MASIPMNSARHVSTDSVRHANTRVRVSILALFPCLFAAAFAGSGPSANTLDHTAASSVQTSDAHRLDSETAAESNSAHPSYEHALALAATEIAAGRFSQAKVLLEGLKQGQDSAELHTLLGKAYRGLGEYRASAIEFQKAAELEPSQANIFDYGTSLFRLDHQAAITILRYGLQRYPRSVQLHVALGTILYADGNPVEGARMLCDAQDLDPSDPHPVEVLAETEIVPPELAARLTAQFAALQQMYPRDGSILFDYTMVRSGRWSKSQDPAPPDFVESLHKALRLNPNLHQAYFQLSLIAAEHQDIPEQIRLLKKAISIAPNEENYHYHLAFAYKKSGNAQDSRIEMKKFQQLHGSDLPTR